jgi:hypothetical protein
LIILSSRGGAEAVIIKPHQAMISVKKETGPAGSSLSQVMDYYSHGVEILSRRSIHNENIDSNGCSELQEVVSKEPMVPPEDVPGSVPSMVNTEYFCEIRGHIYATALRNFAGDTKQVQYQQLALSVAKSLREKE